MTPTAMVARLRRIIGAAWQVARGIAGETAYERYLEHLSAHHPDQRPLTKREFWRQHVDRGDHHPSSRCC